MKAIITEYHGPTATKPAYISAKDMVGGGIKGGYAWVMMPSASVKKEN